MCWKKKEKKENPSAKNKYSEIAGGGGVNMGKMENRKRKWHFFSVLHFLCLNSHREGCI